MRTHAVNLQDHCWVFRW